MWIDSDADINALIYNHFSAVYTSTGDRDFQEVLSYVDNCILESINEDICLPFSDDEIKEVAFNLGGSKAPGPDGFSGMFFHNFWDVVGKDVCMAVKSFASSAFLLKELNQTNVVSIPKIPVPDEISQFRPISLYNFIYKIFEVSCKSSEKTPPFPYFGKSIGFCGILSNSGFDYHSSRSISLFEKEELSSSRGYGYQA